MSDGVARAVLSCHLRVCGGDGAVPPSAVSKTAKGVMSHGLPM